MTSVDVFHAIIKKEIDSDNLVTILELININLNINTISEVVRIEGKSPNGIRKSNRYKKIKLGKQVMAIKLDN